MKENHRLIIAQNKEINKEIKGAKKSKKHYFNLLKNFRNFWKVEDEENYMTSYNKVILIFIFVAFVWSAFAPINSYVISVGEIILNASKKEISHFEGGIIEEIKVKEGEFVNENQDLIILSKIQAESKKDSAQKQLISNVITNTRLNSEIEKKLNVDFSNIEKNFKLDEEERKMLKTQKDLFKKHQETVNTKIDILSKKVQQIQEEIKAVLSQKYATEQMIEATKQELAIVEELLKSENASLVRKLDLQKRLSESEGRLGELNANYDKLKTASLEAKLELDNFKNENYREALKEINETNVNIANLQNELDSSSDILVRTAIKSPVTGFIMDLKYHAIGSVIPPASQIMYVVPKDDVLIAEVKISTRDIDLVVKDMKAKVHLTAYKSRLMPKLKGRVISVSADNFKNEATGEIYFKARIEIPESELKKLSSDIKLTAGMPVEAYIITGSRSLLAYLFTPIKESAYKAFREE